MSRRRPTDATGEPIDTSGLYVAVTSWIGTDGRTGIRHGARRRGDDPEVLAHPEYWVRDGTDDVAINHARMSLESPYA